MNIYEYFRFKSAADIQGDLRQSGKWKNWRSFPEFREDFLEFFNLEDDARIEDYDLVQDDNCAELTVDFNIPTGLEVGNIHFSISYYISGYKQPSVKVQSDVSGLNDFDFNGKYTVKSETRKLKLYIRPKHFGSTMTNSMCPDVCIKEAEAILDLLNNTTKKIYASINDGTYAKACKNADIEYNPEKLDQSRYPDFQSITWLIMKMKLMLSYDLSVSDAILLNVFTEKTLNTLHVHRNAELEKYMKMMRFVWAWEQFADADKKDIVPKNADELGNIINDVKFQVSHENVELMEYRDAVMNASRYMAVHIERLLEEASACFGIDKKYIKVTAGLYSSIEERMKTIRESIKEYPEDWRRKQE